MNRELFFRNLPLFEKELARKRDRLGVYMAKFLPQENCYPPSVHQAMRYAALSESGRYWGIMTLFAAEACRGDEEVAMAVACASECVNAFSRVHEGLPGVGDKGLLGDQPSVHGAFGEGIAILAGDALLVTAFDLVQQHVPDDAVARKMVGLLSRQIGSIGMLGGFVMSILSPGRAPDAKTVEYIYSHKTGSLGACSAALGALVAGASDEDVKALTAYGVKTGTAMMITEDIVRSERESSTQSVGRGRRGRPRRDEDDSPMDYVRLLGLDESKCEALRLTKEAISQLRPFGRRAGKLAYFANYFLYRDSS